MKMNFALRAVGAFILFQLIPDSFAESCDAKLCSNFFDPVCGLAVSKDGTSITKKFHNICHLTKIGCRLQSLADIKLVSNHYCNIKPSFYSGRRVNDFSIMGAHQSCNHTCPTYCRDTYDPACAQIWKGDRAYTYRPMINHCHIDMFSCVLGVNVTIQPLSKCYKNPTGLMFMSHIAALKSMKFIQD